ncbi:hypothetical protein JCM10213v2_005978 [Rhodosporidiobolus nylandii]
MSGSETQPKWGKGVGPRSGGFQSTPKTRGNIDDLLLAAKDPALLPYLLHVFARTGPAQRSLREAYTTALDEVDEAEDSTGYRSSPEINLPINLPVETVDPVDPADLCDLHPPWEPRSPREPSIDFDTPPRSFSIAVNEEQDPLSRALAAYRARYAAVSDAQQEVEVDGEVNGLYGGGEWSFFEEQPLWHCEGELNDEGDGGAYGGGFDGGYGGGFDGGIDGDGLAGIEGGYGGGYDSGYADAVKSDNSEDGAEAGGPLLDGRITPELFAVPSFSKAPRAKAKEFQRALDDANNRRQAYRRRA